MAIHEEVLVVPVHRALRIGTVRAIYRQASRFIPEEALGPHFFDGGCAASA